MSEYLFVCGTLLPELVPDHLREMVSAFKPLGEATVRGRLYDLGEYPGAVLDENADSLVHGRVFQLPDDPEVLVALDDYECVEANDLAASLFIRNTAKAKMSDGGEVVCWIYTYNRDVTGKPLIDTGDYLSYRERAATNE